MPMSAYMREIRAKVGSRLLLMPSAAVALRDVEGRVLLARHRTGGIWAFPGGSLDPRETPADAAVREVWEELDVVVDLTGIVGVYAGPDFVVRYENGDETAYVSILFAGRVAQGAPRPDGDEIVEIGWFTREQLAEIETPAWLDDALRDVFEGRRAAFRPPTWRPPPHA